MVLIEGDVRGRRRRSEIGDEGIVIVRANVVGPLAREEVEVELEPARVGRSLEHELYVDHVVDEVVLLTTLRGQRVARRRPARRVVRSVSGLAGAEVRGGSLRRPRGVVPLTGIAGADHA